jgi:hypothetical protein
VHGPLTKHDQEWEDEYWSRIKSVEETRELLNKDGKFSTIFARTSARNPGLAVLFAAACMTVGVDISHEEMAFIRDYYPIMEFLPGEEIQLEEVCGNYTNGQPWKFVEPPMHDSEDDQLADRYGRLLEPMYSS